MAKTYGTEKFTIQGGEVFETLKRLVHEGNVRRITIKDRAGEVILQVPLTVGVVGAALIPVWAAIGAVVALASDCSIEVERAADQPPMPPDGPPA